MKNNDEILIGACTVYMYEFTGTEIPEHATIETEEHDVGHAGCFGVAFDKFQLY